MPLLCRRAPGLGHNPQIQEPVCHQFFFVKKKDGKLCLVQDYHPLNKWTLRNHNISPLIPQVIDQLAGCILFTKFDICWGYNDICIKEGDKWKAAFLTPEGLFEPLVMFFGLINSPATFQTMVNTIQCSNHRSPVEASPSVWMIGWSTPNNSHSRQKKSTLPATGNWCIRFLTS